MLELRDVRGFGRAAVVPVGDHRDLGVLGRLGPEPDDEGLDRVAGRCASPAGPSRSRPLLLDQSVIGGVGNIYADEALHRARIHPEARGGDLRPTGGRRAERRGRATSSPPGVAHGGTTLRDYRQADGTDGGHQHHLAVYGRDGEPCPVCGAAIVKIRVAGRGTHLCPDCQRGRGGAGSARRSARTGAAPVGGAPPDAGRDSVRTARLSERV